MGAKEWKHSFCTGEQPSPPLHPHLHPRDSWVQMCCGFHTLLEAAGSRSHLRVPPEPQALRKPAQLSCTQSSLGHHRFYGEVHASPQSALTGLTLETEMDQEHRHRKPRRSNGKQRQMGGCCHLLGSTAVCRCRLKAEPSRSAVREEMTHKCMDPGQSSQRPSVVGNRGDEDGVNW
ncbi:hypothetical protein AAY473_013855 [Plecturocebus cupreus]